MSPRRGAAAALSLALALAPGAQAGDFSEHAVGTSGSEFLNLDVGPRGIAMGGAYSAVTDDSTSMYWNPAGLSRVPRASASAMHNEYFAGIRLQYFSYAQRLTDTGVIAGAVRYMDAGAIDNTDVNGLVIGKFRPRNYVYEIGWGQSIIDLTDSEKDISLGITGRWLHSDLVAHADGFGGDLGIQAHYPDAFKPYHFSFVAQNFGHGQKFDQARDHMPLRGRLGASIHWTSNLLVATEAILPLAGRPIGAVGAELMLEANNGLKAFFRAGYNSMTQSDGLDGFRAFSVGTGAKMLDFTFDYAFVPFGDLGNAHRFSVSWNLPAKHSRRFRDR